MPDRWVRGTPVSGLERARASRCKTLTCKARGYRAVRELVRLGCGMSGRVRGARARWSGPRGGTKERGGWRDAVSLGSTHEPCEGKEGSGSANGIESKRGERKRKSLIFCLEGSNLALCPRGFFHEHFSSL